MRFARSGFLQVQECTRHHTMAFRSHRCAECGTMSAANDDPGGSSRIIDCSMLIPHAPRGLVLSIVMSWDGTPCADTRLHGVVTLCAEAEGLRIEAALPPQEPPHIPDVPPLTRVANLWEYDVVECFVVGEERYLEVELGAGGHFLVLDFTAPRVCLNTYETFVPRLTFEPCPAGGTAWRSSIVLPWAMVPVRVKGVNAYVISRDHCLGYHPLPGPRPDFHQPERFPHVRLEGRG